MTITDFLRFMHQNYAVFGVELLLLCGLLVFFVLELLWPKAPSSHTTHLLALVFWILVCILSFWAFGLNHTELSLVLGNGFFEVNSGSLVWKRVLCAVMLFSALVIYSEQKKYTSFWSLQVLLCALLLCACLLPVCKHWLPLFFILGTLSLFSYGVLGWYNPAQASEALKPFILQGMAALALSIFGLSIWLSETHTFFIVANHHTSVSLGFCVAWLLLLAVFWLKLGLLPFHAWVQAVFSYPPSGLLAAMLNVPKIALFSALLPLFKVFSQGSVWAAQVFWGMGFVSFLFGNALAFRATNLRTLIAYTSVAHSGLILMAIPLSINDEKTIWFMLLAHSLGLCALLCFEHLLCDEFTGWKSAPKWRFYALGLALLSLSGLPPFSNFMAKFLFLIAFWEQYPGYTAFWLFLAILFVLLLGVVVHIRPSFYLLRPKTETGTKLLPHNTKLLTLGILFLLFSLVFFLSPDWLWRALMI